MFQEINYIRFDSNIKRTLNDDNDDSNGSFANCTSLIEVFVPSSLNKIGNRSFYGCSSLKKVNFELPSSVTSIGKCAFESCSSLTQISIPSSVTSIGEGVFAGCKKLDKFNIISCQEKRIEYHEDQFLIYKSEPNNENYDILVWTKSTLSVVNIPSFIKIIKCFAFDNCSSLTQVSIPSSVTSIGKCAFNYCSSLTQIEIPSKINVGRLDINSNTRTIRI